MSQVVAVLGLPNRNKWAKHTKSPRFEVTWLENAPNFIVGNMKTTFPVDYSL